MKEISKQDKLLKYYLARDVSTIPAHGLGYNRI